MSHALLIDLSLCVGCGACRTACQEIHHFPDEENTVLNDKNFTLLEHHQLKDGNELWVRRMCQHCVEPACASACLVGALEKTADGAVTWDTNKCIGCRYCMLACPFDIPKYEWHAMSPKVRKCTMCHAERHLTADMKTDKDGFVLDRRGERMVIEDRTIKIEDRDHIIEMTTGADGGRASACSVACPAEATVYGDRETLLAEATRRIKEAPDSYVQKVYGKSEVGGTSVFYISPVPFEDLGFITKVEHTPLPEKTWNVLKHIPNVVVTAGVALGAVYWITSRRDDVRRFEEEQAANKKQGGNHGA
jgi:formate dehydrogenase iron-sulfur subunit